VIGRVAARNISAAVRWYLNLVFIIRCQRNPAGRIAWRELDAICGDSLKANLERKRAGRLLGPPENSSRCLFDIFAAFRDLRKVCVSSYRDFAEHLFHFIASSRRQGIALYAFTKKPFEKSVIRVSGAGYPRLLYLANGISG